MAAPFGDFGVSGRAGTCSSVSSFAEVMNIITTNVEARVKGSVAMKNIISSDPSPSVAAELMKNIISSGYSLAK